MQSTARRRSALSLAALAALAAAAPAGCGGGHVGPAPPANRVLWTRITPEGTPEPDDPDWLGDSIAFQIQVAGVASIATAHRSGSGSVFFPSMAPTGDREPRWVRAGLLLYSSDRLGSADLWYLDVATAAARRLTGFPGDEVEAAPRPGSSGLAYVERTGPAGARLVLLPDTAAAPLSRIYLTPVSLPASEPDWDPTGTQLCFTAPDGGGVPHIWRLSLADTLPIQLTTGAAADRSPRWSPDGTRILFTSERNGLPGVWTVSPAGEGTDLTAWAYDRRSAALLHPAWSPDGQSIIVSSDRSGARALWVLSDLGF